MSSTILQVLVGGSILGAVYGVAALVLRRFKPDPQRDWIGLFGEASLLVMAVTVVAVAAISLVMLAGWLGSLVVGE